MMFERFGDEARRAVVNMGEEARRLNQKRSSSVHLLLALTMDAKSDLAQLFETVGVTRDAVSFWAVESMGFTVGKLERHIPMTDEVKTVITRTEREAREHGVTSITPAQLVLAMLDEPECAVANLLRTFNVDQRELRSRIRRQFAR